MRLNIRAFFFLLCLLFSSSLFANKISYPERAYQLHQNGYVKILYDIDNYGKTRNVRVVESKPAFLFDDSVKKQVYLWRFEKDNPKKDVPLTLVFKNNV